MRVIAVGTLRAFWQKAAYVDAAEPLRSWYREVCEGDWSNPAEIKSKYRTASVLKNSRVVFNIAGNKYRLIVKVNFPYRIVYIRFIGTHQQYDSIDAQTI
jgi:mRNA interferase HigB